MLLNMKSSEQGFFLVIRLRNYINLAESPFLSQMISVFFNVRNIRVDVGTLTVAPRNNNGDAASGIWKKNILHITILMKFL